MFEEINFIFKKYNVEVIKSEEMSFSEFRKIYKFDDLVFKIAFKDELKFEANSIKELNKIGFCQKFINFYQTKNYDVLVYQYLEGYDFISPEFKSNIRDNLEKFAKRLRELHTNKTCLNLVNMNQKMIDSVKQINKTDSLDLEQYYLYTDIEPSISYKYLIENYHILNNNNIVHGDPCLPNVIRNDEGIFFIDLDYCGYFDYHFDIFWVLKSLYFNLDTNEYDDIFLNAYGRDLIDQEKLLLCKYVSALSSQKKMSIKAH